MSDLHDHLQVRIQNLGVSESLEYLRREMLQLGLSDESAKAFAARVEEISARAAR